jgi:hypothetical protein
MKLLLGSLAVGLDSVAEHHDVLTGLLPPLTRYDDYLDFDFSLLLMADTLVYDSFCFNRLRDIRHPQVRHIFESLVALKQANLLEVIDCRHVVGPHQQRIDTAIDLVTENPVGWLPCIRQHIQALEPLVQEFQDHYGRQCSEWDMHMFGIGTHLLRTHGKIEPAEAIRIRNLIMKTTGRTKASDKEVIKSVVKEAVKNTYTNLAIAERIGALPYTWSTLQQYYDQALVLAVRSGTGEQDQITQCRKFFNLAFEQFRPRSVDEWIKLFKNPHILELRARISTAVQNGEDIDAAFAQRSLHALKQANESVVAFKKYTGRIAATAGAVLGLGGTAIGAIIGNTASAVVGLAATGLTLGVQEIIDSRYEARAKRDYGWMYFTSD